MAEREVKVGIIGFGTVGSGVASCLIENDDIIARRTGVRLKLQRVADIDLATDRGVLLPPGTLIDDAESLIRECDIVVELVGGTGIAKKLILHALAAGKPVVTANKALLAKHGEELFAAAESSQANLYYEASVAGGIPAIKALREGLVGNRIECIYGILNGTCNYILTRMEREKIDFASVLQDAQKLGYAEADPTLDINGDDSAHKAAILASLAYGEWFGMSPIYVEGLSGIQLCDLTYADELGYRIKLLAIIKQHLEGDVEIRVHPTLIPKESILASIDDVFNAVMVRGKPVGDMLLTGRGAGRDATASAVVADIVDVALNIEFGSHRRVPAFRIGKQFRNILSMEEIESRYYLRLQVLDRPGVIAAISGILGARGINISSIVQREDQSRDNVSMIILTDIAGERDLIAAIAEIEMLDCVHDQVILLRLEDI